MPRPIYAYNGSGGDAARHIVHNSALQHVVTVTKDCWWAGAECTKVEPPPWVMSDGECELWNAAEAMANQDSPLNILGAARLLDADNLAVLVEALRIYFCVPAEVTA